MKYCVNCGKELADNAAFCPECGSRQTAEPVAVTSNTYEKPQAPADGSSFGFAVLGFLLPLVGLILYLVWKDSTPLKAKSAGKGALISVILSAVLYVVSFVLAGVFMMSY